MEPVLKRDRRWWMIIPFVALSAAIAGGILHVWYTVSIFGKCETDVRRKISSPNGKQSLFVFGRDCGATTGFNTQLSIAPAGGAFSAETTPAFFVASGLHDVTARWLGDSVVEIAGDPGGAEIIRRESNAGDVKVVYK